ncbi:DUF87 domain-containing protein [Gordonibacter pamelaeae]|uniref:VirB4-like conjugal transfer ATPase, CD1110 family n=1 Tax=Gordonibacter pamelaeae TaxID=471189 RepID=UPI00210DC44B|nr:DUF87 domain-containing protein [Gordonibacter pamelaeae]MCQ4848389.1 DUF87 domain-containing protein [Gordonibacter pamelaeae]MCQ4850792.1 DUF87 domain-containing protein [Gordonibacter pamelaeae]
MDDEKMDAARETEPKAASDVEAAPNAPLSRAERKAAKKAQKAALKEQAKKRRLSAKAAKRRAKREKRAGRKPLRRLPASSYPGTLILRGTKSSQDALGYDLIHEDGTIRVEEGVYSRVIEFQDANFQAARREDQRVLYDLLAELYNTFDDSIHLQIKILCRVVDDAEFRSDMYLQPAEDDERGNRFRREINAIIEGKIAETQQNVSRTRLFVMTVEQPTMAKAVPQLARAGEEVMRQLRNMGSISHVLSGNELLAIIDSITNPDDARESRPSFADLKVADAKGRSALSLGYCTKDLVAPPDFTRIDDTHVSWGGCTGQSLYVPKWATSVRSDMISSLAELPINQVITIDAHCWEQNKAIEAIEGMVTDLKVQKSDYVLKHSQTMYITDEMLPTNLQDALLNATDLRDDIVSRDQRMWSLTLSIMTWAGSVEACDANAESIKDVFRRFTFRAEALVKLQGQGFAAALPTGRCDIPYVRNMTTAPLAALVPFTSVELSEPGGMWMGQNSVSKNFIFYDRKNAISPNGFILGKPGRGKSVKAKNTIMWTLLTDPDAEVIVLDPEREYINLAREFDGEIVQISGDSGTYINPFDLEIAQGEAPLAMKTDAVISMVEMMAKSLTEMQKSLVDRAVSRVYDRYFETHDKSDFPTLTDFYTELMSQPEEAGKILATTIERYVNGQASLFNHATNVNIDRRFVVYDLRDCADNMKGLALLILLDNTWQRIVRNRERGIRTWLFIDEMQLLFEHEYAISYFDALWTRSRKYGAIPTGITQNIERVINNDKTRLMLANSDFLVLLGQSASDAAALGEVIKLSEQQIAYLRNAAPGEGLLVAGGKIIPFVDTIPADNAIYRLVTTKIDDLIAYRVKEGA